MIYNFVVFKSVDTTHPGNKYPGFARVVSNELQFLTESYNTPYIFLVKVL